MEWHYAHEGVQIGPVDESVFVSLVNAGTITAETLVWRQGMTDWQPYGTIQTQWPGGDETAAGQIAVVGSQICAECGNPFSVEEMVQYGSSWVCAACKPVFFQRLQEGAVMPGTLRYGGFWIRFAAKFIDGLIVGAANFAVNLGINAIVGRAATNGSEDTAVFGSMWMAGMLINYAVAIGYATFFLGKFAATPGKMACGLRVVRSDGSRITYVRAFGRYCAEILSSLILLIGYIMAGFDEQKRTLHDRICDTRVVHK